MASYSTLAEQSLLQHPECRIFLPPEPPIIRNKSVFLAGSIGQDRTNWQNAITSALAHLPITILNPRRIEWDLTWVQDISNPLFKEQVEWELDALDAADVIAMFFAADTLAPVSLLELGLHAASGKMVVCCPEGYWRRGNVQVICARHGIELVETLEELTESVLKKLAVCDTEAGLEVEALQDAI